MIITQNTVLTIKTMDTSMCRDVWQNSLDEDNRRFVPDEVFETIEDAKEVIDFIIQSYDTKEGPFIYAVTRNEDDANIGYVQLIKIDDGWEIGYHIAKRFTGHGYATTAVKLFLDYIKNKTDLKEIIGIALADNKASVRVLEKCGFSTVFVGAGPYQGKQRNIVKTIKRL